MPRKNTTGLSKAEIAVIKEAFDLYDPEHTGFADIADIKEFTIIYNENNLYFKCKFFKRIYLAIYNKII